MPAGQRIKGEDGIVLLKDVAGTVIGEVPCLVSFNLDTSASVVENSVTCMKSNDDGGSGATKKWTEATVESKSWSGSLDFLWQKDQTIPAAVQLDPTKVGDKLLLELYVNDKTTGSVVYSGNAIIETAGLPVTVSDDVTQTVAFKGDGALTKSIAA